MVIVIIAVIGAIGWYVWARLIRDPAWPWPPRRSLTGLYVIAVLAGVMAMDTNARCDSPLAAFTELEMSRTTTVDHWLRMIARPQ